MVQPLWQVVQAVHHTSDEKPAVSVFSYVSTLSCRHRGQTFYFFYLVHVCCWKSITIIVVLVVVVAVMAVSFRLVDLIRHPPFPFSTDGFSIYLFIYYHQL